MKNGVFGVLVGCCLTACVAHRPPIGDRWDVIASSEVAPHMKAFVFKDKPTDEFPFSSSLYLVFFVSQDQTKVAPYFMSRYLFSGLVYTDRNPPQPLNSKCPFPDERFSFLIGMQPNHENSAYLTSSKFTHYTEDLSHNFVADADFSDIKMFYHYGLRKNPEIEAVKDAKFTKLLQLPRPLRSVGYRNAGRFLYIVVGEYAHEAQRTPHLQGRGYAAGLLTDKSGEAFPVRGYLNGSILDLTVYFQEDDFVDMRVQEQIQLHL